MPPAPSSCQEYTPSTFGLHVGAMVAWAADVKSSDTGELNAAPRANDCFFKGCQVSNKLVEISQNFLERWF